MPPIQTVVLGVGLSGLTFHVPFVLALTDLFALRGVLERNPKSEGGKVKERFGVDTKIYRSIDEVLADAGVELVIVGTPNSTHYALVKQSLEAGKHVLVDKPVVPTAAEARELLSIAKSKNLVLYAYQNRRWDSDFLTLKKLLAEPSSSPVHLGDLVECESHYDRYKNVLKGVWKEENLPGAGLIFDLGTHLLDQIVSLFGRPENVTGFLENVRGLGDPNVDDSFTILLQYAKTPERKYAMKALVRAHALSARDPQLRYVVRGTKGTFIKYGLDVQEDQIKAMPKPAGIFADGYGKEPENIWGEVQNIDSAGKITKTRYPTHDSGAYVELFRNLAGAIRNGEELKVKWEQAITVLEIVESARQSSKEGRTIHL